MGVGQRPRASPASGLSSATASATRPNSGCWRPTRWTASPGGPEAVLPSEPGVSRQPGRGAGHPGRDLQGPSRADRVLRLPVLRGTAPRRSRRATRRFLRPATGRLGTADTHRIPPPLGACLDRQRHATRGPRPETPPRRRYPDSPRLSASSAITCTLTGGPQTGGYSGAPAAARSAKASTARSGIRPAPRPSARQAPTGTPPYDLRHAALSLWLASGAPPAEVAARAGHSTRVLLTVYAHCIPGCDQITSQQIEQALSPSQWPCAARKLDRVVDLPVRLRS
jgi:hypothetical protein